MFKGKFIKSADENNTDDQFEIDETIVDEVSNAEEFADVEISNEDIMDAIEAIDALAEAVIEKANVEEKEIDADTLLDEVRDLIDEEPSEEEEEISEEEELPEELTNSAVRVMVSEDGAVELESTPDEVYDSDIDDVACTVFDTCDEYPVDIEETAPAEETEDDVLVIGNSNAKNFKKGYIVLKSSANKKAWSSAVKKVKKMVGSKKAFTAAHWAIVSAVAKKEEEDEKLKKKIECKLIKILRSNKDLKAKLLKSSDEFDSEGQPIAETKPEETAGTEVGHQEEQSPTDTTSPEEVDSQSGNPVVDPDKEVEGTSDDIVLPEGESIVMEVPLTNSKKKITLKKVVSNKRKNYAVYKVLKSTRELETLDGKVIKCGKVAYAFRNTGIGLIACAARYADTGKGNYKPVMSKNNTVVIGRGKKEAPVFQNAEKIVILKRVASARSQGRLEAKKEALLNARNNSRRVAPTRRPLKSDKYWMVAGDTDTEMIDRDEYMKRYGEEPDEKDAVDASRKMNVRNRPVTSRKAHARRPVASARRPVTSRKPVMSKAEKEAKLSAIMAKRDARTQVQSARNHEKELRRMYDKEERARLFQSSQKEMNEEKKAIKSNNTRNAETMNKLYKGMF